MSRANRAIAARFIVVIPFIACVVAGCSTRSTTYTDLGTPLIEFPGVVEDYGSIQWTPDGRALLWQGTLAGLDQVPSPVFISDATTGETRALDLQGIGPYGLRVLSDGDTLIYLAASGTCFYRYSLSTGAQETVHCDDAYSMLFDEGWYVSPDGGTLAYGRFGEDGLYLYDTSTGATRHLPAVSPLSSMGNSIGYSIGSPQPFSPDGRRMLVLYTDSVGDWGAVRFATVNLETGVVQPVNIVLAAFTDPIPLAINWTRAGIKLLFLAGLGFEARPYLLDADAGTIEVVDRWSVGGDWSRDGSTLAGVSEPCYEWYDCGWGCGFCTDFQGTLWFRDLAANQSRPIAWYNSGFLSFCLSPDGTKIAYFLQSGSNPTEEAVQLYVAATRF